jgi:hypothetical protein
MQLILVTLSGIAVDSVNLGTFTGSTIADNLTVKAAFQAIETAFEEADKNVDDLISLSGVAENAVNLGAFTGTTITDNSTVKGAFQLLETAHELLISDLASQVTGKGANLIGVELVTGKYAATTVDAAIEMLYDKTHTLMTDLATASDGDKGANLVGIQALANRTAASLTVQGGLNILDADLKTVETWKAGVATKIHKHYAEVFTPAAAVTELTTTMDCSATLDFFSVYVNGVRQLPTIHYTLSASTTKTKITFTEAFLADENAYIEIVKYDV